MITIRKARLFAKERLSAKEMRALEKRLGGRIVIVKTLPPRQAKAREHRRMLRAKRHRAKLAKFAKKYQADRRKILAVAKRAFDKPRLMTINTKYWSIREGKRKGKMINVYGTRTQCVHALIAALESFPAKRRSTKKKARRR